MDSLDIKIFLAMGTQYYTYGVERQLNLRSMAKQLSVDSDTIRTRIKKMEESLIKYYQVFPNFHIFGLYCLASALIFSNPAAKKAAFQNLKLIEEVAWMHEYLNSLDVLLFYREAESDLEKKLTLIEKLTGVKPIRQYIMEMPPVGRELSLTDWRIVKSMRYNARKPTKQVAQEVGLTPRAVNYRLQRLRKENAFFIVPVVSFENLENVFCSHFIFFLDEHHRAEAINEITRLIGERYMDQVVSSEGSVSFCVPTTSIIQSENDYLKAKAIPGVEKVLMDFLLACHDVSTFIDKLIDQKILDLAS